MKRIVTLLTICVFALSACSNTSDTVSRDDYESLANEVEDLKNQIESMKPESADSTPQEESQITISEEPITYVKELLGDFSFDWDENNKIALSLYQEGEDYFVEGYGTYEEGKLFLLQENYYWTCEFTSLYAREAEIIFTVGDEEYKFLVSDYQVIADTIPMENWNHTISSEYYGKQGEYLSKIKDFYDSTIWN